MSKVLVTGSAGLVGSACVHLFKKMGWEVVGIDANMRTYFFGTQPKEGFEHVDIRDEQFINMIFQQENFDAIIHTAAQPSHDWAKNEPLTDFDINARGTLILLEATRKYAPNAVFVYVSTDKVYGENMGAPLKEEYKRYSPVIQKWHTYELEGFTEKLGLDFAGKRSLFGCSKAAADMYVQEYGNYFGIRTACFRPGCITERNHAGAEYHGFLAYLAQCIKEGKEYKIFGDGKQVRDQIHAEDLASAFYDFIENPEVAAVYNIGGGLERSVSVLEAIDAIEERTGKQAKYTFHPAREGDRKWDVHDVSKFREHYPEWDYRYSLADIFDELCTN
mgnify:CR=1 FL=1